MTDQEITRALAEKCRGWTWGDASAYSSYRQTWIDVEGNEAAHPAWDPLSSDTDCMGCVDKMTDNGRGMDIIGYPHIQSWGVSVGTGLRETFESFADCPSGVVRRRAICIAILKALGEWKDE